MKKKIAIHLFFLIAALPMLAQQLPINRCGTKSPPKEWEDQFQQLIKQYLVDVKEGRVSNAVREIPVIVHVIHGGQAVGTPPNISAPQINSQIQILNDDVEGNGFNVQNIPDVFEEYKADLNIKFMMATVDTMGIALPEPGIHRVDYKTLPGGKDPKTAGYGANEDQLMDTFDEFIADTIKKNTIWNPQKYFNIWLTETKIPDYGGAGTWPANSTLEGIDIALTGNAMTDGIWCRSDLFGLSQNKSPFNMGRIMSHETGHWLGLLHIYGDAPCGEDYCSDTPPAKKANFKGMIHPLNKGINACPGNTEGEMFMNLMDNSEDSLKFMFTRKQSIRTQTALLNGTYRKDLGKHNIVAAITVPIADYDVSDTLILKGKEVTFTNTSLGTPNTYLWDFGKDAEPQTSALKDPPPVKYTSSGMKMVSLTVTNGFGTNMTRRAKIVKGCVENVPCADFEALVDGIIKNTIEMKEAIYFKNISSGKPTSWNWKFEGGTPATSTEQNPRIVYNVPGVYKVKLSIVSPNGKDSIEKKNYINVNASYNKGVAYTCISIDTARNIWAGTNKGGVFFLNKKTNPGAVKFDALPAGTVDFSKLVVQSIACDSLGNTWVAHGGTGGNTAGGGGMDRIDYNNINTIQAYSPDRNALGFTFFERDGLGTLNVQCVRVGALSSVWTANKYHDLHEGANYIITPGGMSYKKGGEVKFTSKSTWKDCQAGNESYELPYPAYTYNPKITESPQTRTCPSIGCGKNEAWLCSNPYLAKNGAELSSRILRYDLNGNFIAPAIDFQALGLSSPGGLFNGVYITPKENAWVTISWRGFGVRTNGVWQFINLGDMACIFPAGLVINQNAIWGNKFGNVFIGTTKGLIVYKGDGNVKSVNSYSFYPLSNAKGGYRSVAGGVAEYDSIQWIATDDGIIRTVIGKYDMTKDDIDYTSCNKPDINDVEAALKAGGADLSFHSYEISTEVCDIKTTAYPDHCNAEHVYSMLIKDVNLTIPNPYDYPPDVLNNIYKKENKNILFSLLTKTPFEKAIEALTNSSLSAEQNSANPSKVISCQEYKLYNNSSSILARHLYDKGPMLTYFKDCKWAAGVPFDFSRSMDDYCGNKLEAIEYDRILIFANDKKKSITNYTAKGHLLYPGKIERTVVEECGKVKIVTKGVGKQYCGDNCRGELLKKTNIVISKHLFTEVDKRLVTSFKNGN